MDQHGYSEAKLQSAWRTTTQQEIAASIIGYIRRAAIGEALISFEQRVQNAMQHIYSLHSWTHPQRRWLDRLAKSLIHEVVIDKSVINNAFQTDGGAKGLDKILGGQLDNVVNELNTHLWDSAAG